MATPLSGSSLVYSVRTNQHTYHMSHYITLLSFSLLDQPPYNFSPFKLHSNTTANILRKNQAFRSTILLNYSVSIDS
jgi:hypothetical protein